MVKQRDALGISSDRDAPRKFELVLKADVAGTVEAVHENLYSLDIPGVELSIIQEGVGPVSKSDLFMAQTGSKLVAGFNVGVAPKLEKEAVDLGVEVRLYELIQNLSTDIEGICRHLERAEPEEEIIGKAKVIATFKAAKGMIIGCEVTQDVLQAGKAFRIITAMGPAYTGTIGSLQIERRAVKSAKAGQQAGIQVPDWKGAKVGDLVECFETRPSRNGVWYPRPGISRH